MSRLYVLLSLTVACALRPAPVAGQTSEPVWARPDVFWYGKSTPGGPVWLKVNVEYGVKEPLFDHQRLATELTIRTGVEHAANALPFMDPASQFVVRYDGSNAYIQHGAMAIEFIREGHLWRCELQIKWNWNLVPPTDYQCGSRRPLADGFVAAALPRDTLPRVSPDGAWEALIVNHNVVVRPRAGGDARALSTDGVASNAYQLGSIVWSDDSKALAAYRVSERVWLSDGLAGNVKALVARKEWRVDRR